MCHCHESSFVLAVLVVFTGTVKIKNPRKVRLQDHLAQLLWDRGQQPMPDAQVKNWNSPL